MVPGSVDMGAMMNVNAVAAILNVVQARLNGEPKDRADWAVIVRQLQAAVREAEKAYMTAAKREAVSDTRP